MKLPSIKIKLPKLKIYGIDVIKNALFFTFYILLTLFIIAFIMAPSIKAFKSTKNDYFLSEQEFQNTKQTYQSILEKLTKLQNQNQKILNAFKRNFNKNNFKLFAKNYINIIKITKQDTTPYKDKFIKTSYMITAQIKSPKNFYDFVDNIKNYKNIIRVYFPIDFEKSNKEINLTFKIEHYKLKPATKAEEKAH